MAGVIADAAGLREYRLRMWPTGHPNGADPEALQRLLLEPRNPTLAQAQSATGRTFDLPVRLLVGLFVLGLVAGAVLAGVVAWAT